VLTGSKSTYIVGSNDGQCNSNQLNSRKERTMSKPKPMREVIYDRIMEGGATKEILMEIAGTTAKGLSSQFTYLRMMGRCPMLVEDDEGNKTYKIVTPEEWENHRAEVSANSQKKTLSPEKRLEKAGKRVERAVQGVENTLKRKEANPDNELYDLQYQKAVIENKIANIELANAEHLYKTQSEDGQAPAEDEDNMNDEGAFA
jgi:hypothetical protein